MSMDLEDQYDKIYRYCYFKLHHREIAEDVTQETFLRFLDSDQYYEKGQSLRYLYTIARNLCIDEFRRQPCVPLPEELACPDTESRILTSIALKTALDELSVEDQELLLLRYVNEVPVATLCGIYGLYRFAIYRKATKALKLLQDKFEKEEFR